VFDACTIAAAATDAMVAARYFSLDRYGYQRLFERAAKDG